MSQFSVRTTLPLVLQHACKEHQVGLYRTWIQGHLKIMLYQPGQTVKKCFLIIFLPFIRNSPSNIIYPFTFCDFGFFAWHSVFSEARKITFHSFTVCNTAIFKRQAWVKFSATFLTDKHFCSVKLSYLCWIAVALFNESLKLCDDPFFYSSIVTLLSVKLCSPEMRNPASLKLFSIVFVFRLYSKFLFGLQAADGWLEFYLHHLWCCALVSSLSLHGQPPPEEKPCC